MIKILNWDTKFFGFTTARLNAQGDLQHVIHELENAFKSEIHLLYVSVSPDSGSIVHYLNKQPYSLVDHRLTYQKHLNHYNSESCHSIISINGDNFRKYQKTLNDLALLGGLYSRFKLDAMVPNHKFEEMYFQWIKNTLKDPDDSRIFAYRIEDFIVGLVTVSLESDRAKIGLLAVKDYYQRISIGKKLMQAAEKFACDSGKMRLDVVTQKMNRPACSFYKKLNYNVTQEELTYHLWLK